MSDNNEFLEMDLNIVNTQNYAVSKDISYLDVIDKYPFIPILPPSETYKFSITANTPFEFFIPENVMMLRFISSSIIYYCFNNTAIITPSNNMVGNGSFQTTASTPSALYYVGDKDTISFICASTSNLSIECFK